MKKKSVIIVLSVLLNLVLFSVLIGFNKFNSTMDGAPAPYFVVQHLGDNGHAESTGHEIASASTMK
jgi:hypothetical protein